MGAIARLVQGLGRAIAEAPLLALVVIASALAFAFTPLAFLMFGRTKWFFVRRGRGERRPEFWSVVCSMILVMGLPAIVLLMALKSQSFDRSRYEFDPNHTISVLDQGREYRTLKEADEAVREERKRLEAERKALVDQVKQLDEAMLGLRASALQNPGVIPSTGKVLDRLATLHRSIGLDAPHQLLEELGTPAALAGMPAAAPGVVSAPVAAPVAAAAAAAAAPVVPVGAGMSASERDAVLASVPPAQKELAAHLPLSGLPAGWVVGGELGKQVETFTAENLYEKIDGRAESFLQYDVKGMAYAFFHPEGNDELEAQVYIFEMPNGLKAFGKYSSEKPDEGLEPLAVGSEGYVSAGSVLFYAGKFYVQIVTTSDDPKLAAFAKDLAQRVAGSISGKPVPTAVAAAPTAPAPAPEVPVAEQEASPELMFKLLPTGPGRAGEKYAAQDVFAYSFLTDVFLADYEEGKATWQGFVRPYQDAAEAEAILAKYEASVKEFGGQVEAFEAEGATRAVKSSLDGLTDVFFIKGNTLAGANGSTESAPAEAFAKVFARSLPDKVPALPKDTSAPKPVAGEGSYGEQ
jgi:hypothetical protein